MLQNVYVLEGPAGSGKSTLAEWLREKKNLPIMAPPWDVKPAARHYANLDGEIHAITRNLAQGLWTLTHRGDCIVDRWSVSSFVYNQIRCNRNIDDPDALQKLVSILNLSQLTMDMSQASLIVREVMPPIEQRYTWVFNMPPLKELQARRANRVKEYPYSAEAEWKWYHWVIEQWPIITEILPDFSHNLIVVRTDDDRNHLL